MKFSFRMEHKNRSIKRYAALLVLLSSGYVSSCMAEPDVSNSDDSLSIRSFLSIYDQYPFLSENVALWFLLSALLGCLSLFLAYSLYLYVSKSKDKEQKLTFVSYHDPLTGVHNRTGLLKFLNLTSAFNRELKFCAISMDIKDFKYINYAYGEDFGDQLLVRVGEELKSLFSGSNITSRVGTNEFVVVDFNSHDMVARENLIRRVKNHFEAGILVGPRVIIVRFNVGVSLYPNDTVDTSLLLQYAHVAMLRSKESTSISFEYYHADMAVSTYRRIQLLRRLEVSVVPESESLQLLYQPIVMTGSNDFRAEALIRWNDNVLGFVPPDEFIGVAEESPIINAINEWVIRAAAKQINLWNKEGLNAKIAINISRFDLYHHEVLFVLQQALDEFKITAKQLIIEIRESTVFENSQNETVMTSLKKLNEKGFLIAIDDFGTGFSNFSHLNQLPIDIVKIDKSLVQNIGNDEKQYSICEAIFSLCNVMDKRCVVEGVEDEEQFNLTQKMGVHYFQGYHIAKPLLPIDITEFWQTSLPDYSGVLHSQPA